MKHLVIALVAFAIAVPASAQVPQDVPDGTGRDLGDEQNERRTEAYRDELQHLYASTQAGAGPAFQSVSGLAVGVHQSFGVELAGDHVISLALDAYQVPATDGADPFQLESLARETVGVVSLQYHHNLRALVPRSVHARRATVVLAGGVAFGGNHGSTLTLTPTYTLPINRYWSMPVGVKVSHLVLDSGMPVAQRTFVGVQLGVRYHLFGHRDQLE